MLSFFKKNQFIGLDLQDDEIRLLQFSRIHKKMTLEKCVVTPLPLDAIVDGKIKQPEAVLAVLKNLVKQTQTQGCATAIALPMNGVISKQLTFSQELTPAEIEIEILQNPGSYLSGIQEKIAFDFQEIKSLDNEEQEIVLVATRNSLLQDYLDLVTAAGLNVKIIDVAINAMLQAMALYHKNILVILNIDYETAQLIISQQQQIIFNQHCSVDANVDNFLPDLCRQLQRLLSLFHSMHPEAVFENIFLTGNKIISAETVFTLQTQLGLKLELANPLQFVATSSQINIKKIMYLSSRLVVGCGLGMRLLSHPIGINLLPWRKRANQQYQFYYWLKRAGALIAVFLIGLMIHRGMDHHLAQLQSQQAQLETQIKSIPREKTLANNISYSQISIHTHQFLNWLTMLPKDIFLTKISRQENIVILTGEMLSANQLPLLITSLKRSHLFSKIILTHFSQKTLSTLNFQIELHEKLNK